jgi:UDP-glucuronate decarboxylase
VVSNMITQALRNSDITVYGDGSQTRSFCYVDDMVDGLLRMASHERPINKPINLGNPIELTVRELADHVLAMTASRSRMVERPLPVDDPKRRKPDIGLAKKLLGWTPRVPLARGLGSTIRWFRKDPHVMNGHLSSERDTAAAVDAA